jgi:hypothetical protein
MSLEGRRPDYLMACADRAPRAIGWLVGTGLGAVAFAERYRSCPLRSSGLTEPAWGALCPSPNSEPGVQVSPGSPCRTYSQAPSAGRITKLRVRQFEPRATQGVAQVQPALVTDGEARRGCASFTRRSVSAATISRPSRKGYGSRCAEAPSMSEGPAERGVEAT